MSNRDEGVIRISREELIDIISTAVSAALEGRANVRQKIDMADVARQIATVPVNLEFRRYFQWEYRLIELFKERARRAARDTYDFIDANLKNTLFDTDQFAVIAAHRDQLEALNGVILDFGVYKGSSTRALARIFPAAEIHGFDSFEGLPEAWSHVGKGAFGDIKGQLPEVPANVALHKGWFEDSVPDWLTKNANKRVSILRIDCDIYSSTKTIFDAVGDLVVSGGWIVFDELIGYYGWEFHEQKAFKEWLSRSKVTFEYVAYGLTYVIVKITK